MVEKAETNGAKESSATLAPTFGTLKLTKKRKQQAWQAYHSMTYENRWKAVIDQQWATRVDEWKASHADEKMTETRFAFMNKFMKDKFDNETDEVKKEVEEYREKQGEEEAKNLKEMFSQ